MEFEPKENLSEELRILKNTLCNQPGTILNYLKASHVVNLASLAFDMPHRHGNPNTWNEKSVVFDREHDKVIKIEFNDLHNSRLIFAMSKGQNELVITRFAYGTETNLPPENPELFYRYLDGIIKGLIL